MYHGADTYHPTGVPRSHSKRVDRCSRGESESRRKQGRPISSSIESRRYAGHIERVSAATEKDDKNEQPRYQKKRDISCILVEDDLSFARKGLFSISFRAATPVRTAAATPAGTTPFGSALAFAGGRWAYKSVVDVNGLVKQLGTVQVLDGLSSFGKG